jgi:dipeptidyl aminopeptidase/acylaminoacyl peptidase
MDKKVSRIACFAAVLGLWLCAEPSAAQTIPAEVFGRLPDVADVSISPDGRRVALARNSQTAGGAVSIIELDNPSEQTGYRVGQNIKLRDVRWADNVRVVYLVNQTVHPGAVLPPGFFFRGTPRRVDYWRHGVINTSTGQARTMITNLEAQWADTGSRLIAPIEADDGHARMIGRHPNPEFAGPVIFRMNMDNARGRHFFPAGVNRETLDFILDRRGDVIARLDSEPRSNRWRLFVYDGATPRLLWEGVSNYGEPVQVEGVLPDGRLVARYDDDAGFSGLYAIHSQTGVAEPLFRRENADVSDAINDPWTREVVGVSWLEVEAHQQFFQPDLEAARQALAARVPGAAATLATWSQDRRRFIAYIETGLDGGGYYLFEPANSNLRFIAARYPELRQAQLGQRQSITYRARDGVSVPAYLTLPNAPSARNLPLVLLVHGGPHSRDTMDFDYWAAFLASRGYAVLQPNFRGSSGYGRAWEDAGRRQWGGLMQTDVEDGVAAIVRAGIADESRVCIVGASYGGYAALAGATLTPDRYRCAVSVAGVSDLIAMLNDEIAQAGRHSMTADWWRASIGDRSGDRAELRNISPVNLADRVRIPILLMHGTDDTVVPIDHSRRMQRALQGAGKDVRFVELRGDDHWLSDAATRIQMLEEMEGFLGQHLGSPGP